MFSEHFTRQDLAMLHSVLGGLQAFRLDALMRPPVPQAPAMPGVTTARDMGFRFLETGGCMLHMGLEGELDAETMKRWWAAPNRLELMRKAVADLPSPEQTITPAMVKAAEDCLAEHHMTLCHPEPGDYRVVAAEVLRRALAARAAPTSVQDPAP